ncbi:hypothetical protein JAAARDRAFT_195536 [Jaapia argillacea MUCL 33604]|uniref:Protein kinase domain-containing protein n=1 Tax=Jaapia argillacea MUCL 33604 TaxID=933084 RepID=A0A067PLL9_9AGAM|nr:hypothetical protein JAAARDRAFT_195536 [Jaapia argillacea MUCL 33604]
MGDGQAALHGDDDLNELALGKASRPQLNHDEDYKVNPTESQTYERSKSSAFTREITILDGLKYGDICGLKEAFLDKDNKNIHLVLELIEVGDF